MAIMGEQHYQMLWHCSACGTRDLLGITHRCCPACGSAQDPKNRYFPPEGQETAAEGHVYVGADRLCPYCSAPQSAKAAFCGGCGGDLNGAKEAQRVLDTAAATGPVAAQPVAAPAAESPDQPAPGREPTPGVVRGRSRKVPVIVWALVTVILIGIGVVVTDRYWTRPVTFVLAGHTWSREIEVETYTAVRGGDWCDSRPGDSYNVSRSRRQRGTEQVAAGETCHNVRHDNGDGSFSSSRECSPRYVSKPVYDTWCDYTVNRWRLTETLRTGGRSREETPEWPGLGGLRAGSGLGAQRPGARRESYVIRYEATGAKGAPPEVRECPYPQAEWSRRPVGSRYTARKGMILGRVACDTFGLIRPAGTGRLAH